MLCTIILRKLPGGTWDGMGIKLAISSAQDPTDNLAQRKERGAFFTPDLITKFMAEWAIRSGDDNVLEPSAGDAAFLVAAVKRLRDLSGRAAVPPVVHGVEIHSRSAVIARERIRSFGGTGCIEEGDFFAVEPKPVFDAVIGNPPYIRYQDFSGDMRARSRAAALRAGVVLSGLASSWAAFTVHSTLFLKQGGRLALVLPAELLSVNYASPVRKFLFGSFREVQLVLFDEQVFPEAEADVVLLLADGYHEGPAGHATIRQARNAAALDRLDAGKSWAPRDPAGKWTSSLIPPRTVDLFTALREHGLFSMLEDWGDTTLGMVTGNNKYFTLSPQRARELGLGAGELLRLSPPGSAHLRGLSLTKEMLADLGEQGSATYLFYPHNQPSAAAQAYIADGHRTGVDTAYKCRVRKVWYRVPLVPAADLFLTCMNADTPRITTNRAGARHLNSVHGVYLREAFRKTGRDFLPLASLNSVTLLHAEMVGRSYGGGLLKIEPREADIWAVPSFSLVESRAAELGRIKGRVTRLLGCGKLIEAVELVDHALLADCHDLSGEALQQVRNARAELFNRRTVRANSGR